MNLLGLHYAPLNVPLKRRLQTLSTFIFMFCMVLLGPVCSLLSIYLLFTQYFWIVLIYACYRYFDGNPELKGGRPTAWVRNLAVWCYYRDYFPMKLIKTAELSPKKNYVMAVFPHGAVASGGALSLGTDVLNVTKVFPGIKTTVCTLETNFKMPAIRELLLALGTGSVSKESLNYLLSDPKGGRAAMLAVGGAAEALLCRPGDVRIVLKNRKGFVKMALKHGASLVPVMSYGENEIYDQLPNPQGSWLRIYQEYFKKYTGISPAFFFGRGFFQYTCGLLPRRRPINVVVGKPIAVNKTLEPTEKQINELHQIFMTELRNLFEEHKHKYLENAKNISLIIE